MLNKMIIIRKVKSLVACLINPLVLLLVFKLEEVVFVSRGREAASKLSAKCQKQPNNSLVFRVCVAQEETDRQCVTPSHEQ